MPNNIYICSFADTKMKAAMSRFEKEAQNMKSYDGIYLYDETLLEEEFYKHFQDKFSLRGFGYFVWKPQVILQTLQKMNYGDILQYSDIGCHLNKYGKKRLNEYFKIVENSPIGILAFQTAYQEKNWTKADLFHYFGYCKNANIVESGQFCAGIFIVKKSDAAIKIIQEWREVFYNNFSLVDDSPSGRRNFEGFIENRNDQSVFSLLAKKYNFSFLDYVKENCFHYGKYPILALRDRGTGERWYKALQYPAIIRVFFMERLGSYMMKILIRIILGDRVYARLKAWQSKN